MNNLIGWSGKQLITPYYHTVSANYLPHINPIYSVVNPAQFESDLEVLAQNHQFISANELFNFQKEGYPKGKTFAFLSFDDGLVGCYDIIRDILKKRGIPATFFINPPFTEGRNIFFRYKIALLLDRINRSDFLITERNELKGMLSEKGLLKENLPASLLNLRYSNTTLINELIDFMNIEIRPDQIYMTKDQVSTLVEDGFSIGGHSMDHPHFSDLALDDQLRQIGESVDYCQKEFNQTMRLFAFPFYDYDLSVELFEQMQAELEIDLSFGTSGMKIDLYQNHFQRLAMERNNEGSESFIRSQLLKTALRRLLGKDHMDRS